MNILQYDVDKVDSKELGKIVSNIEEKGVKIVVIPKDFDLLLDCDSYYLYYLKNKIEDAIRKKEIINNI